MKKVYIKFDRGDDLSTVRVTGAPKGFRDKLLVALGGLESAPRWGNVQYVNDVLGTCRVLISVCGIESYRIEYQFCHLSTWEKVIVEKEEF